MRKLFVFIPLLVGVWVTMGVDTQPSVEQGKGMSSPETMTLAQEPSADSSADIQFVETEVAKEKPDWEAVFQHLGRARVNANDQEVTNLLFLEAELHFEMLQREPSLTRIQRDEHMRRGWMALQRVVRRDSRHIKARRMLSQLYGAFATANPQNAKAWQDYIGELDGILSIDSKDAETYFLRAKAYAHLSQMDSQCQQNAIDDLHKAIEFDKTNAEYRDILAKYLVAVGQTSEAERVFREAIQINPNKALLHVSYARLLRQQKRLEESQKQIQEAIQCEPSSPLGYLEQAGNLLAQQKLNEAEMILKKAQTIAPTDIRVYAQYVFLYRLKKDQQAADRVLREGLAALDVEDAQAEDDDKIDARRRGQNRAMLNYMLADVLLDLYAVSKDEKEKEKLLSEVKERYQILSTLGATQYQKDHIAGRIAYDEEKWSEARTLLEKVVNHDPTSRVAVMLLNVYRHLGIPGQSEKLAEYVLKTRRLTPQGRLFFLLELAQLRMAAGKYDEAQKLINQAAEINADDDGVKRLQRALDAYHGKLTGSTGEEKVKN